MPYISEEARAFLDGPSTHLPYDLSPEGINAWRSALRASVIDAVERAVARHKVTTKEIEVDGISCMEVLPPEPTTRTILYCFGGGYVSGSAFEDLTISAALATHCGARIIAPHYRLAPEYPYPTAVEDGMAVARSLSVTAPTYAIVGESAGGNLALALTLKMRAEGVRLPDALALLSPWCDLTNSGDSLSANDGRDPTLRTSDVALAARAYAGVHDLADPGISPLFASFDRVFPPTILTTGTRDLLLSPTVRLAGALRNAGVSADLRVWEEMWHVFEFYDIPEADRSLREIAGFLNERL